MIRFGSFFACVLVLVASCGESLAQAATAPATRPGAGVLQLQHLRIDRPGRRVVVEAAVSLRQGALEFLLCTEGTKDYESLLSTKALPSSLHAALLSLGLAPGKPARWTTPADKKPVFVPPRGARLDIRVRWTDPKGARREAPVTDWLLAVGTNKKPDPTRWVFVGSGLLDDGRYWADVEGHHVSLANFASGVVDVPFESSDKTALLEFAANDKEVPPKATKVQVVIAPVAGAEKAPDARIGFRIDGFGRIEMDGMPVAAETIPAAVKKFLARHARAAAEVVLDPRALVYDRERLQAILAEAGLTDVTFRVRGLSEEVLPRTADQAARGIAYWKEQFARAKDLIVDPAEDAAATLKHIARRRQQLEAMSELWADYAARLQAILADYKARKADEQPSGD